MEILNTISSKLSSASASAQQSYNGLTDGQKVGAVLGLAAALVASVGVYAYTRKDPSQSALFDRVNAAIVDGKANLAEAENPRFYKDQPEVAMRRSLYVLRLTAALDAAEAQLKMYSGIHDNITVEIVDAIVAEIKDIGAFKV